MGRAPCCDKNGLKKGPWTAEEDQKLMDYIQKHGYGNWRTLPKNAGLQRCGKSCRLRWTNYLRPDIKRGRFSFEEEETIIQLHSILGNKWSAIAGRLPGRTDNEIKNYWNTHIRKRLLRMGIDPVTHSPRLDLLDLSTILMNSSSLYPNHHLLSMHPNFINPDLLRLATSLLSSSSERRNYLMQNYPLQNHIITNNPQLCNENIQLPSSSLPLPVPTTSTLFSTQNQVQDQFVQYDVAAQNLPGFGEWQQNHEGSFFSPVTEDYGQLGNYSGYYGSDQSLADPGPSSETSTLQSNSNNFNFQSVLSNISTPSSSPTPLNSGSNYNISGGGEDERESYCSNNISNVLKFEIPADILDVADFI